MEMQEMIECPLSEIRAVRKADQEELQDMMKANREDLKSSQVEMRSIDNAWMTDIKDARKKTTASGEEMEASIKKMEPNLGEKETAVKWKEIPNEEVAVHSPRACQSKTSAFQEAMEAKTEKTESHPGAMQPMGEHQEIPKEKVIVKPVKGRKKRHRGRKSAAGRRGEPKELTQGNCGPRKRLTASGIRTTPCAKVARGREHGLQRQGKDDIIPKTQEQQKEEGEGLWKGLECNSGIRDRVLREQLRDRLRISDQCGRQPSYLRKEKTTTNGISGCSADERSHLGSEGTPTRT
jgi:hypothetical protein